MIRRLTPVLLLLACSTPTKAGPDASASPAKAASCPSDLPETVATVAGTAITRDELEEAARPGVLAAELEAYEARKQALDSMVTDKLLEAEASKRGTDIEGLLKAEIDGKVPTPGDAEVDAFYAANAARIPGDLETMRPQIVQHLRSEGLQGRMMAFMDELKGAAEVETFLPVYRVEVAPREGAAHKGPKDAPVHIIEFSDFQCPYCTRGAEVVGEVIEAYGDKVSFEYRHFPLDFHDKAHLAAEASECANEQGSFWEYHDLLFANQSKLDRASLLSYAGEAGLDATKFESCLTDGRHAATVDADMENGAAVGMSGTPGFYVNGRIIQGAQPLEAFRALIDEELEAVAAR